MTRLCERPGCSEPGAVAYQVAAAQRTVTLAALDVDELSRAGVLCRRHADSMVVPLGWTLDDRREAVPRLFRITGSAATAPARRTRGPRRTSQAEEDHTSPLPLFVEHEAPPAVTDSADADDALPTVAELAGEDPEAAPDETRAIPWNPRFDTDDDLDGLLSAETPLLARAFGNARRRPRRR